MDRQADLEAAHAAVERWAETFNAGIGSDVAALYSPGASLWGTLATTLLTSPQAASRYFTNALLSTLKVRLGEHSAVQLAAGVVIDAGRYEFTLVKDSKVFPARYSFALVNQKGNWLIAHHHSSMLPGPPG